MSQRLRVGLLQFVFAWLNLALTAPSVYLWLGLPLVMRQHGWSGADIGLFQLAGLPAVFKFVLAAPVERHRFAGGHYRMWAIGLCVVFALVLGLIGSQQLLSNRTALFGLAFAAALMATWADVPVNALAIKLLPASQRMRAGGLRSAALSLGAIVGGGVMLLVQTTWGWSAPFWLMAGGVGLGVVLLMCMRESLRESSLGTLSAPAVPADRTRDSASPRLQVAAYFAQPGAAIWTGLLLTIFPFVGTAWFYLKPLLLDHGFAPHQVAWVAGIGGGVLAAFASMASTAIVKRVGLANAVSGSAWFSFLALAMLACMVRFGGGPVGLGMAAAAVALAMGMAASLSFGLMMFFTQPERDAVDYGVQASLFSVSRMAIPLLAGLALDRMAYDGMVMLLCMAMLCVVGLARYARPVITALSRK